VAFDTPLLARLALCTRWEDAKDVLVEAYYSVHDELPEGLRITIDAFDDGAGKWTWPQRRSAAIRTANAMTDLGHADFAAGFGLLAVDPVRGGTMSHVTFELLQKAFEHASVVGDRERLSGWEAVCRGKCVRGEAVEDPFVMAWLLADTTPTQTPPPAADGKPPLLFRAVTAKDWPDAARTLRNATWLRVRGDQRVARIAFRLGEEADPDWGLRFDLATVIAAYLRGRGDEELADAWTLLAIDPYSPPTPHPQARRLQDILWHNWAETPRSPADECTISGWGLLLRGLRLPDPRPSCDPVETARRLGGFFRIVMESPAEIETVREQPPTAPAEPEASGVIVLRAIGGTSRTSSGKEAHAEFERIVGQPLPLVPTRDPGPVLRALAAEFPYAATAISLLLADLSGSQVVKFRPTLLLGPPGAGKTRLIRRIGESFGLHVARFDGSGSSDNAFGGTARRWSSGEPCIPLNAIRTAQHANPLIHVDEIDKAGTGRFNGSLTNALLPMLEPETAARYPDPYVQADVDLSRCSYFLTANDDTVLPAPLRDRLRTLRIEQPAPEHLPAIAAGLVADYRRERSLTNDWIPNLDGDELEIAAGLWKGGSIRRLRTVIDRILARRDARAPRN
jgi:ATPase family associated with various cellular activities (AAA)